MSFFFKSKNSYFLSYVKYKLLAGVFHIYILDFGEACQRKLWNPGNIRK